MPVSRLQDWPAALDWVAKGIWLAVPLQAFALFHVPGGIQTKDFVPATIFTLAALASLVVIAFASAFWQARPAGVGYQEHVRGTLVGLLLTWSVSLVVLDLSYLVGDTPEIGMDLVGWAVTERLIPEAMRKDYPWLNLGTAGVYLIYASAAALLVHAGLRAVAAHLRLPENAPRSRNSDPSLVLVIAATAAVLMVTSALSHRIPFWMVTSTLGR